MVICWCFVLRLTTLGYVGFHCMAYIGIYDCLVADVCQAPLIFMLEGDWMTKSVTELQESAYWVPSHACFC